MIQYIKEQNERLQKDFEAVTKARKEWIGFNQWSFEIMQTRVKNMNKLGYFDTIHTSTERDLPHYSSVNKSFMRYEIGNRYTGVSETITDPTTRKLTSEGAYESGGSLIITQDPKGGVMFIVFPSKSDIFGWNDKFIILNRFTSPSKISHYDIVKAMIFYEKFSRYTSIYSNQTFGEKIQYWWIGLKLRDVLKFGYSGAKVASMA